MRGSSDAIRRVLERVFKNVGRCSVREFWCFWTDGFLRPCPVRVAAPGRARLPRQGTLNPTCLTGY